MIFVSDQLKTEFFKAKKAFSDAQKVVIISHRMPDGDAIGSNVALRLALEAQGKTVVSADVDPVPENSRFLAKADSFVFDFNYEEFDVIVSVDCGDLKLVKFPEMKPEILTGGKPFINFDHHDSNALYGTINPVEKGAAATATVIYKFMKFCEWPITIDIATAMLHGIYFDTGSLQHSNTTGEVYEICADLFLRGANLQRVSKELFHTTPVRKLKLWGRILEKTYVNEDGVTISAAGKDDYSATGAGPRDTGGVIDFLNAVPGSKYCVLLSEDDN
ncbi:MAG: DHH family phosphoesterase, partial [Candidatus Gracilibacteria bacterium]